MAPKTATKSKAASASKIDTKKSYKEMITIAITTLKDRSGSSRQSIKKYISSNYPVGPNFDSQFNLALNRGVKGGDFVQPKGSSGPVKLAKKEAAKKPSAPKKAAAAAPKKAAAKKAAAPKKTAAKKVTKPAPKKTTKKTTTKKTTTKKAVPKKAAPKKAAPKKAKK